MAKPELDGRRVFLKKLLGGAAVASGSIYMVYKQPAVANLLTAEAEQGPLDQNGHEYAFVVDINRCIGCGNCVKACGIENNVPEGQYRTWIERYVVSPRARISILQKAANRVFRKSTKTSRSRP